MLLFSFLLHILKARILKFHLKASRYDGVLMLIKVNLSKSSVKCCPIWQHILVKKETRGVGRVNRAHLLISNSNAKKSSRDHFLIEGKILTCHHYVS